MEKMRDGDNTESDGFWGWVGEMLNRKGHERTFWGDAYILPVALIFIQYVIFLQV